ncbi:MAG TPA: universal stress protein [Kouleothrix sp.]|mgnify:CR=1 FL=1|uniref:universal stress protein n=1 Tax=Kouleothrix sp. TaxID=2779161 RepID=UPI002C600D8E|nr:universal stress protein [Kouleothrix sp.]
MKTILVPLDGSALAEQILQYVQVVAPLLDASVRLVQVVSEPAPESVLVESMTGLYGVSEPVAHQRERSRVALDETLAGAEAYLAARAARLEDAGLEVTFDVQIGSAPEIIVDIAHSSQIKLIAMATHGYSGLRRWVLGSVADRVVQAATVPVLLIRATQYSQRGFGLSRVLLPLDGSELALQALPLARELALKSGAELMFVEAVSPDVESYPSLVAQPVSPYGTTVGALHDQAKRNLAMLADQVRAGGVAVASIVENGPAAEVIVDEATRQNISLIVMATHGRGGLRRWAMGSVADKVLHAAHIPLLLVRVS